MRRSFINEMIDESFHFIHTFQVKLPEFAYFTVDEWKKQDLALWQEVFDLQLGWDITDFSSENFNQLGLRLFTLRNGSLNDKRYPKCYAEKMLIVGLNQETPYHFHLSKMEDILNRGGGDLCMQLYHATQQRELDDKQSIIISIDGKKKRLNAGDIIVLKPGQSICLSPCLYHRFWAEKAQVLAWEVSTVNDDYTDNHFLVSLSRFSNIEEDREAKWVLCNEYSLIR